MKGRAFILEHTRLVTPFLCPEIPMHLITDACPLWHATEEDLAALSLEDPYWGFCWAGGQALARYLLDHPEGVAGRRVVDFGAGCGVEAIAAMRSGARTVVASDIDPLALEAIRLNALANGVAIATTTQNLLGDPLDDIDVLLAGDMFYDPTLSKEVLQWFKALAIRGRIVLLADPGRGNLAGAPVEAVARYEAPSDIDLAGRYLRETTVYRVKAE